MPQDRDFVIEISNFNEGLGPLSHIDSDSFVGNKGQASEMLADVISMPSFLMQSPSLSDLTNGTQAGVVDELIRFILDKPTAPDTTFAIGSTKLFKLSSTTVSSGGSPSWPQTVSGMTEGESVIRLKTNLYAFFNKASGGDILKMPLSTEVIDATWGSTTATALENAPHPSAVKEDIMLFGNGRYVGAYIEGAGTLDVQKLDFGEGTEVVDVVFNANIWWIAVNYGEGKQSRVYAYDGSALSSVLQDEAGIGDQKIGFLYVLNGIVYIAYDDKSSDGFNIGFLSGRQIKPLRYFSGTLPNHRQKALYKNTILFVSASQIKSFGASIEQLPLQISTLADGGYDTVGGIASPFGTPLIASSDGSTNYRLAKFSGYSISSNWKSILIDITKERYVGRIETMIVYTKPLAENAGFKIKLWGDQDSLSSSYYTYTDEGSVRKIFKSIDLKYCEDIRVEVDFSNGDTTNTAHIRKIVLLGTLQER